METTTDQMFALGLDPELFDYDKAQTYIKHMINAWSEELEETRVRRKERYLDLDVDKMRQAGELEPDETFIPERVIDTNILQEQPAYLSFLNQSRRLAIFHCTSDPSVDTQILEAEFTRGLTYKGWLSDFYRCIDGAQLHGWDSLEVVFDVSKPLHVAFEHIGHDKLIFNRNVDDLQDSEYVIRAYNISAIRLQEFVRTNGFDATQVEVILGVDRASRQQKNVTYTIYKVYFKFQGIVYIAWCGDTAKLSNWLKAPEKLHLGISAPAPIVTRDTLSLQGGVGAGASLQTDIDMYPVFVFHYRESEEHVVTSHVGRSFLDSGRQEAQTAIMSSFVNGMNRAANVYAAPVNGTEGEASIQQTNIDLVPGAIYSQPLQFFHQDYPDVSVLLALQHLSTENAQQTGNVDFAVINRKDARKTAKEMDVAQQNKTEIKSVPIALYSEFLRGVFDFAWRIVQSQALQDKVMFCLELSASPAGLLIVANNKVLIDKEYDIRPAGDVDFVQRLEKIQQMRADWPVIQTTALANTFLQDLIRLSYPDKGDEYANILAQGDPRMLIAAMLPILKQLMTPEAFAQLTPDEQQQYQQIITVATQTAGMNANPMQQQNLENTQNQPPAPQ